MDIRCDKVLFDLSWLAVGLQGLASEGDDYAVFYGERLPWWIKVT